MVVRVHEHERFEREADDLIWVQPIAFAQAALGTSVEIETIDGSTTSLEIPAGTQHGEIFRIAGQGLPNLRSRRRGEFVVILQLIVPKKLDDEQRKLLEQYAELEEIPVSTPEQSFWKKFKDKVKGN